MADITIDIMRQSGDWENNAALAALSQRVVDAVFALPHLRESRSELSILFTDNAHIRKLNHQWRGKDNATNVLSFPAFPVKAGGKPQALLGDIILGYETVVSEAKAEQKPVENHISHLIAHGCLHLLGYDHETEADAKEMEALEIFILAGLGIDDPYAEIL